MFMNSDQQVTLFDLVREDRVTAPLSPSPSTGRGPGPGPGGGVEPAAFITESRAAQLFMDAARVHRPNIAGARVSFHPFRATLYTFKIRRSGAAHANSTVDLAHVKFHVAFRRAPELVVAQAAAIMLCRSRGRKTNTAGRAAYDAFVRAMPPGEFELPGARKGRRLALAVPGRRHSLDESFARVNRTYFQSQLEKPELCWSPVRARRLLGSYHERKDRLIISQIFDSNKVPAFVLDYLMYHELLHKFLGIGRRDDGRRSVHSREFKQLEKRYAQYGEATAFLQKLSKIVSGS